MVCKQRLLDIAKKTLFFLISIVLIFLVKNKIGSNNVPLFSAVILGVFSAIKKDLGFKNSHASISLALCYLLIIPTSILYNLHFAIALPVNIITIFIILFLTNKEPNKNNHIIPLITYFFAIYFNVTGKFFTGRIIILLLASLGIGAVYFICHQKLEYEDDLKDLLRNFSLKLPRCQWIFKIITPLIIVMFIGDVTNFKGTLLLIIPILFILQYNKDKCDENCKVFFPASVTACVIFLISFSYIIQSEYWNIVAIISCYLLIIARTQFLKSMFLTFVSLTYFLGVESPLVLTISEVLICSVAVLISQGSNTLFNKHFKKVNRK